MIAIDEFYDELDDDDPTEDVDRVSMKTWRERERTRVNAAESKGRFQVEMDRYLDPIGGDGIPPILPKWMG